VFLRGDDSDFFHVVGDAKVHEREEQSTLDPGTRKVSDVLVLSTDGVTRGPLLRFSRAVVAQAAQAAHENTLGYACHELRNPLHAISASAGFLAETIPPGSEGYEDIQSILTGAGQMHRLVNDVLDLGKLRAGKLAIQPEPFDLR
jgi:signal transduction histidine kinase